MTAVDDASDCVEVLARNGIDAVVVGDRLPADGIALLERLQSGRPARPLLVSPTDGSEELAARAIDAGATTYVPSDASVERLATAIQDVVGGGDGPDIEADGDASGADVAILEERYRRLVETAPFPINLIDEDGTIVWCNETLVKLLEADSREALLGRAIFEFVHGADAEQAREELAAIFEEGAHVGPTDFRVETETGRTRALTISTTPTTADGERLAQAVVADVTQLDLVVEALRTQRNFVEDLLDTLQDVFYLVSPEGTLERWNDRLSEVTGYSDAELAGMAAADLMHPDDRDRPDAAIETAIEEGESFFEATVQAKTGATRRYEFRNARVDHSDGRLRGVVGIGRDVTERERIMREAQADEERYRTLVELSPNPILVHHPDGVIRFANQAAADLLDADSTLDVIGEPLMRFISPDSREASRENIQATLAGERAPTRIEREFVTLAGETKHVELSARPITYEGERALVVVLQDITARNEHERTLTRLHEVTREMMAADASTRIAAVATRAATDRIDLEFSLVYSFDDAANALVLVDGVDAGPVPDALTDPLNEGPLWECFVADEPLAWGPDDDVRPADVPAGFAIPLGNHGVFLAGRTDGEGLSAPDRDVVRLLAGNLEAAFDRADRTAELRERDARLATQNESLDRVNRLNEIVRRSTQAVVRAATRDEIEQDVCDQLAAADRYAFVWLAGRDTDHDRIVPRRWAGVDAEYIDHLANTTDAPLDDLVRAALETRAVQVQPNVLTDPAWESSRRDALTHGFQAIAAVPVVRDGVTDGVFVVHAQQAGLFDDEEQAVLAELGRTVGYAIQAVARNAAVESDERTELELRIRDDRFLANRLATATGAEVEFVGGVPENGGVLRAFFRLSNVAVPDVEAVFGDWESVHDVHVVSATETGGLYQFHLSMPWLVELCRSTGATLRSMHVSGGETAVNVTVPSSIDVRSFVETIQDHHPSTELVARHSRAVAVDTRETFREHVRTQLTDRQREALQTAHYGGFYEWPRECSTQELGAMLDIASSTFQYHLRAAERKVVAAILADTVPRD